MIDWSFSVRQAWAWVFPTHDLVVYKWVYVAVRDETPNMFYHIAKVSDIGETPLQYIMGTSDNLSSAT